MVPEGVMPVPQGAVSMLCVLCILLCGPGVHSHVCDGTCQGLICNGNGCIYPSKSFANIGEELVLNCTLRDLHYSNSSMLYFTIGNGVNMSSDYQRVISPYVLELRVPVVNRSLNEVTVQCAARGRDGDFPWTSRVRVDYPLREVTDLEVVVHDWRNISITWHMVDYIYTPIVNTSWTILDTATRWETCDDSGVTWCFLDSYHEDGIYNISVHITSNNGREQVAVSSTFNFSSGDYVQPAAVSEVGVIRVDSRCVELRWNHSHSHSRNLTYRLSLHSTTKEHQEKIDPLMSQRSSERVCKLRPDTEYRVDVSVRPTRGGLWSESQSVNFTSLQDYPEEGAVTTDGGFVGEECTGDVRTVYVYLVPPDEFYWNGELTNYKLVYVPSDGSSNISATTEPTSVLHKEQLNCHLEYNVYISVYNKIGGSPPSLLHIPRQDKDFGKLNIVLEKNNTEYEMVLEDHTPPLTLFWCRGTANICQERLSWRQVDRPHLRLPINYNSSCIYGLAVKSYTGSSGISWVQCIVDVEDPSRPLPPSVESRPDHGLTVSWGKDRCPVSDYTIQHCTSDLQHCHDTVVASDYSEYVIRGLEGGVNYSVRVRQGTVSGRQGPYSQPVFAVARGLTESELAGLAVGSSLGAIIILSFLLCCVRRVWRNYHRKETITLPKISQEYGEQLDTSTTQDCNSPPALPARVLTPGEQRSGRDGQSSGLPHSGLHETIDLTGSISEVQAPDWGGWVFTDLVESDSNVDPYVTAAANEDDHHIDDNVCDNEINTWANTNCVTSDSTVDSYVTAGTEEDEGVHTYVNSQADSFQHGVYN